MSLSNGSWTFYEAVKNGYQKFFNVRSRDMGKRPLTFHINPFCHVNFPFLTNKTNQTNTTNSLSFGF